MLEYRRYAHQNGQAFEEYCVLNRQQLSQPDMAWALIRPEYVGICSADIREIRGTRISRRNFGHEILGTVLESARLQEGQSKYVVLNPEADVQRETAFSQLMWVYGTQQAVAQALHPVPGNDPVLVLAEPLACVIHACYRLFTLSRPRFILVVGAGFFGWLFCRYLALLGISCVLINRHSERLAFVKSKDPDLACIHWNVEQLPTIDAIIMAESVFSHASLLAQLQKLPSNTPSTLSVMPFGAVLPDEDLMLYRARERNQTITRSLAGRTVNFVGTLGTQPPAFTEAITWLSDWRAAQAFRALITHFYSFADGVQALNRAVIGPAMFGKSVIALNESIVKPTPLPRQTCFAKEYTLQLSLNDIKSADRLQSSTLKIRQAVQSDEALLVSLYAAIGPQWRWCSRRYWKTRDWSKHLDDSRILILLATVDENPIGFAELNLQSGCATARIKYLGLLQGEIGKGYGRALLCQMIYRAKALGVDTLLVSTRSIDHPNARKSYLALGFSPVSSQIVRIDSPTVASGSVPCK